VLDEQRDEQERERETKADVSWCHG
jgi:hypothetical protein